MAIRAGRVTDGFSAAPLAFRTLEAAAAARLSLEAGFTTLRDTDSEGADFADVAVRDAIAAGLIPGPRLLVSTMALSITGGHMNHFGLAPAIDERVPQLATMTDTVGRLAFPAIPRRSSSSSAAGTPRRFGTRCASASTSSSGPMRAESRTGATPASSS